MAPAISVLLPVRDGAATVERAVLSVLAQTFDDLEVLAVDDGSTDETPAVLARLAAQDARVRVLRTAGVGIVGALNLALAEARAGLIARMDADDESLPERFEHSVAALRDDARLAGVGTGVEIFRDDRPPSPNFVAYGQWLSSLTTPELLFRERLVESPLCHPSVLLRREALEFSAGWLGDFGNDAGIWTLGPLLVLGRARLPVSLVAGVSPTVLSRTQFGSKDFGINFQFTTHIGVDFDFARHWRLTYQYQHMSDAHLSEKNPALNMNLFGLCYVF